MCVHVYVHACIMFLSVYVCMRIIRVCVHMCVHVWYIWAYVCVLHTCMCVYVCVFICVHVCLCVFMCSCMCTCVYKSVCTLCVCVWACECGMYVRTYVHESLKQPTHTYAPLKDSPIFGCLSIRQILASLSNFCKSIACVGENQTSIYNRHPRPPKSSCP